MFRVVAAAIAGGVVSSIFMGTSGAYAALAVAPFGGSAAALLLGAVALYRTRDTLSTTSRTCGGFGDRN